jgi:hypothetical protein
VTITDVTDNFPVVGYILVPVIVIAEPNMFCGFPGESITNGEGRNKEASTKRATTTLVLVGNLGLIGSRDFI